MSTESFTFRAGTGIAESVEDETMLLLGAELDEAVKWIALPEQLGGEQVDVRASLVSPCINPNCSEMHRELELDATHNGKTLYVMECGSQYMFYTVGDHT